MSGDGQVDGIALEALSRNLAICFRARLPEGYRRGRARIRDMGIRMLDCSATRAQRLTDGLGA